MAADLTTLDPRSQTDIRDALAAIEAADDPVPAGAFRALHDPNLRRIADTELRRLGRTLIECDPGWWTSGYDDDTAAALIADAGNTLDDTDLALLAVVLLHSVAVPRASGRIDSTSWLDAEPVDRADIERSRALRGIDIKASLRKLRDMGVLVRGVRPSIQPGPQFHRVTETGSRRLWAELVAVADPDGLLAARLREDPTLLDLEDRP